MRKTYKRRGGSRNRSKSPRRNRSRSSSPRQHRNRRLLALLERHPDFASQAGLNVHAPSWSPKRNRIRSRSPRQHYAHRVGLNANAPM